MPGAAPPPAIRSGLVLTMLGAAMASFGVLIIAHTVQGLGGLTAIAAAAALVSALVPVRPAVGPDPREQAALTRRVGSRVGS